MINFLVFASIFLLSFITTRFVRKHFLRLAILDIPNERSSHTTPTPRGGGISIALAFFTGLAYLHYLNFLPKNIMLALMGGILIAIIGWLDDIYSLPARWRIVFHLIAALWAIYWLHGFPTINIGTSLHLGWVGSVLAILGIIWSINFYNFMDGIDGLAGSEAIFVSIIAGLLLLSSGSELAYVCFLLIPATLGFLVWNWPAAKIFMGDVGSGLLGYLFAVLAIAAENQRSMPIIAWIILLAIFVFDTTFTLLFRIKRKQAFHIAHREHAYQQLSQRGWGHQKITLSVILFNIFILAPFSIIAFKWPHFILPCLAVVIVLLLLIWIKIVFYTSNAGSSTQ
jgi:Fuc2NAc and GlcNAc transferase